MSEAKDFAELVAVTRVPLADLAARVVAAAGDQVAIDAAIDAVAEGMTRCYWGGVFHWVEYGRRMAMRNKP